MKDIATSPFPSRPTTPLPPLPQARMLNHDGLVKRLAVPLAAGLGALGMYTYNKIANNFGKPMNKLTVPTPTPTPRPTNVPMVHVFR